ncbi:endogenous retrovirus group K member 7 Gag polyprotein-like [Lepus europaeus]|uniref:endogenous retrovirus group K member 7 Gag polyprotein-like n=1 Tax=Lepus europaeus TaxID=9983 RepID=UPI002B493645|nr:endogenous retrovirus group K member 7 Gag polyprotein-like [Lepus europaeus]
MGQAQGKQDVIKAVKTLLQTQGIGLKKRAIEQFTDAIETVFPWFAEEGVVDEQHWNLLGKDLNAYLQKNGPESLPVITFSLWSLIKETLAQQKDKTLLQGALSFLQEKIEAARSQSSQRGDEEVDEPPQSPRKEEPSFPWAPPSELSPLHTEVLELKQQITQQSQSIKPSPSAFLKSGVNKSLYPEKGVEQVIREAVQRGEPGADQLLGALPVEEFMEQGQAMRRHHPVPFKILKDLKAACDAYGPTAPYTRTLLDSLAQTVLAPADWKTIARACLSGADYLLWRSEFFDQCRHTARLNAQGGNDNWDSDMLAGQGAYEDIQQQVRQPIAVFQQTAAAARRAWNILPTKGAKIGESLSKTVQGPDEPYSEFVNRLLQVAVKIFGDPQAGLDFVTQLAYENANIPCKQAIRPYRKRTDLDGYIKICIYQSILYTGSSDGRCLAGNVITGISPKDNN